MPTNVIESNSDRNLCPAAREQKNCDVACVHVLRKTALFAGLADEQLRLVAPPCRHLPVTKGTVLFGKGGEAKEMYVVLSGEVCLEDEICIDERLPARTIVVEKVGGNGVLGLCALNRPYRWLYSARCTKDADLVVVQSDDLKRLIRANANIGLTVLENAFSVSFERLMSRHQRALAELGLAALYDVNRNY